MLIACAAMLLGPLLISVAETQQAPGPRAGMADLRVRPGSYAINPPNPRVGDYIEGKLGVRVNVTVENIGDADTESGFAVAFYVNATDQAHRINSNDEGEIQFGVMPMGDAWNVSEWWWTDDLTDGVNYTVIVVVDVRTPEHPVPINDSNVTNNIFMANQSFRPRLYPELSIPPGGVSITPAHPFAGDDVAVNVTIINSGEKNARDVEVYFYLNDTSHPITTFVTVPWVNLSGPSLASAKWNTTGLAPASYTLLVCMNPPWAFTRTVERDRSDNNATQNVTLAEPMPDLLVRNITCIPLRPRIGQGVVVTGEVANAGSAPSEPSNLSLFVDFNATAVATAPMPSLGPGESRDFALPWNSSGLSAAVHRMRLTVDPDYALADANQTNNTFTWSMEFEGVVDLMLANLTVSPASPHPGDTVHFSVTVINAGTLRCNSANLTLRIGGAEADRKQLLTLSAGGQLGSTLRWSSEGTVPGSYDFEVSVSPGPGENDSDTGNNILAGQIVVQPAPPMPDLRVASMTLVPAGPVHNGDVIKVAVTVGNAGNLDANGSFLDLKLETASGGVINFTDSPVSVPAIPAGGFATVNVTRDTQSYQAGNYSLKALADFRGDLAESNESNNIMIIELRILEALPKLPRLGVEELILEGKVEQDQKLNIFVVINNTGEADAMNIVVNFIIDGKLQGSPARLPVIGRQSNRTASLLWVPAAGKHTIGVTVSADGIGEQSVSRSVTVPPAPSVANPYMLAAGIGIIAVLLGAVLDRAIGATRRPTPRLRLIEEDDAADEAETEEGKDATGDRDA